MFFFLILYQFLMSNLIIIYLIMSVQIIIMVIIVLSRIQIWTRVIWEQYSSSNTVDATSFFAPTDDSQAALL